MSGGTAGSCSGLHSPPPTHSPRQFRSLGERLPGFPQEVLVQGGSVGVGTRPLPRKAALLSPQLEKRN